MEQWTEYVETLAAGLQRVVVTDRAGANLTPIDAVRRWVDLAHATHQRGRFVSFIGNGASAAMASHMAADACKNGFLRALAFNDAAMLTATGNDLSYDEVFSLPLERLAEPGDLLVTISSSGNSPNVLRALDACAALGVNAVTLSGKAADNQSRTRGDLNFYVALGRNGWTEPAHHVILHYWFDQYLRAHGQGPI